MIMRERDEGNGFITIDCGAASNYTDAIGLKCVSDAGFIDTGKNHDLPHYELLKVHRPYYKTVRSFPNGTRNCYTLKPVTKGNRYLIRASFFYGNYDKQNRVPQFGLYIGVTLWKTIVQENVYHEIITVATSESISICLQNTMSGTPYISALALRPLKSSMYTDSYHTHSLVLHHRHDAGAGLSSGSIGYPNDTYDRIWNPLEGKNWNSFSASHPVTTDKCKGFEPPSDVMVTAVTPPDNSDPLNYSWDSYDSTFQFHVYRHFAELELLQSNMTREFLVCCGDNCLDKPFRPEYLVTSTVSTTNPLSGRHSYTCSLTKTQNSTLPPILNAIEVYSVLLLSNTATNAQDVEAIANIHKHYNLKKIWMGDPCLPKGYPWDGLTCSYPDNSSAPTIKSLNLSSSGLNGRIASFFGKLTSIEILDLSGNNLSGPVPSDLGDAKSLSLLNLLGNQLNGSIPSTLQERSRKGLLELIVNNNPNLRYGVACKTLKKKQKNIIAPILASVGTIVILLILMTALWILKYRKQDILCVSKIGSTGLNTRFTFEKLRQIAPNIGSTCPIGSGSFGDVYMGKLDDGTPVAVKMLHQQVITRSRTSEKSIQDLFLSEVKISSKACHKNLVEMKGYCLEEGHEAIVLEYMPYRDLRRHLNGTGSDAVSLNWNRRLQIALDVANGLKYLHEKCKPCIVHRDLKPENILLNYELEAKISDFGLSKCFPDERLTHLTTEVRGTEAYLDPQYEETKKFSKASDIYSFGIILLELITAQPHMPTLDGELVTIVQWTKRMREKRNMRALIDRRLACDYDEGSAHKAVELALRCTNLSGKERPTLKEVIKSLKECTGRKGLQHRRPEQLRGWQRLRARQLIKNHFIN